jgi:UBX domain-containing protein 1
VATLGSLSSTRDEDDDEDDDDYSDEDESNKPRDLFAGGEKSGLAVQDPARDTSSSSKKLIQDILQKAKSSVLLAQTQRLGYS